MPRTKTKPTTTPSDLPVTVVALADLTPYPRNPRHITPAAVNAVADSLVAFGWQQPIVIDPRKVIVAGHTRRLAALQIGWTHAPTVTIPAKHAAAYRLADKRIGDHSTQKPIECMERPIRNHKGDVYDPFVGSGTTIIAAEREKRRCYAMEIAPEYVDLAVARWEAFTGRTATR